MLAGPLAGKFDSSLIGFSTRVAEEDFVSKGQLHKLLCKCHLQGLLGLPGLTTTAKDMDAPEGSQTQCSSTSVAHENQGVATNAGKQIS